MAGRIRSLKMSEVRNAGVDRNPMSPVNTLGSQVSLHGGPRLKGNAPTHYHRGGGKNIDPHGAGGGLVKARRNSTMEGANTISMAPVDQRNRSKGKR